ncbi:MAG TPA: thiamine phosphate synthase [Terriglobales bacterium]|nr:thiamine phosphate synthase [Terriglobales bacterium]
MADGCLLYYITDRKQFPGDENARRRALLAKVEEAARAGVDYIQLREKDLRTRDLEALARECVAKLGKLRTENRELRTRLLINSRTDIALAAGADGVHLRSDDILPSEVRRVWTSCGAGAPSRESRELVPIIGVSCHSTSDVLHAKSDGADFAVFAPVFEKKDAPQVQARGLETLRETCPSARDFPVLALGGITIENAASCVAAGAAGIAAIRLFQENKIEEVVRALR